MMTLTLSTADLLDRGVMGLRSDGPRGGSFATQYKPEILAEYDAAYSTGRGVLLCSSHLSEWREARAAARWRRAHAIATVRPGSTRDRELAA